MLFFTKKWWWGAAPEAQLWTDYGWYISQTTPWTPVYIWDYTINSTTRFDEVGYQTMIKDARPRWFVSYNFSTLVNSAERMMGMPPAQLWLWDNSFLPYWYFSKEQWRYTYLPFELTVPEDFSEEWDDDNWELFWYVNFTVDNTNDSPRWRTWIFWVNFNYANQQCICRDVMWNRQQSDTILLETCRMTNELVADPIYATRDDLTTIERDWWLPSHWADRIRPYMKIRWVLFRDTERDDYSWNLIPLQIGFRYRKNRLWTKYPRANEIQE